MIGDFFMRANRSNLFNLLLIVGAVALAASFSEVLASPSPSPSASPTAAATLTPSPSPQAFQPQPTPQPVAQPNLTKRPSFGRGIYPPAAPPFRQK